jgi:peptidoglycan/LPS O-acetylase OafA/YrhL
LFFLISIITIVLAAVLMWNLVESRFLARSNHYRHASVESPA